MTEAPAANNAPAPPAAGTPEAAQAEIASLRASPEFAAKFASGDPAARQRMNDLHKAGWPPEADAEQGTTDGGAAKAEGAAVAPQAWPLTFAPDTPAATVVAAQTVVSEMVAALGIEPELARGGISTIQDSIAARGNQVMTDTDFARLDYVLKEKLGDQYDEHLDRFTAAMEKTKDRGAWLKNALKHCSAEVAAWVMISLTTPRGEPRR